MATRDSQLKDRSRPQMSKQKAKDEKIRIKMEEDAKKLEAMPPSTKETIALRKVFVTDLKPPEVLQTRFQRS